MRDFSLLQPDPQHYTCPLRHEGTRGAPLGLTGRPKELLRAPRQQEVVLNWDWFETNIPLSPHPLAKRLQKSTTAQSQAWIVSLQPSEYAQHTHCTHNAPQHEH